MVFRHIGKMQSQHQKGHIDNSITSHISANVSAISDLDIVNVFV